MPDLSSREVARKLGISPAVLSKYLKVGKVPAPKTLVIGRLKIQSWTEAEVEHVRQLLPKIKNGRKTRYKKKQLAIGSQQLAKAESKAKTKKKPPPRAAVPHKQRSKKKS